MANDNIVIVGTGIAAINAVKAIREHDQAVTIDLLGAEPFYPYNRMKLSKSLFDQLNEDQILLQKKEWYQQNKVNFQREAKVQKVDTVNQKVLLDNGREVAYGKLLIATGAGNRVPPIDGIEVLNASTLRSLNDARAIHDAIATKQCVLHIGGGIQGLETAWILRQHQKQVIIAEIQPRLMPNQLDQRSS
ncbi:MAG TPA: FAD-dependent oxidoreductase, partial [Bacillota bacterium]|nr:FAD-dependent oxidoreductase [Bacillota bacterium]